MAKKILVVDDEPNIVKMVASRLKATGYDVISAADGVDGLNKARSDSPDLIILDLMLPKMDGYKVCGFLKHDQKYKQIPIIIFTARVQDETEKLGYEAGAEAYIPKPFDAKVLLDKIEELLSRVSSS